MTMLDFDCDGSELLADALREVSPELLRDPAALTALIKVAFKRLDGAVGPARFRARLASGSAVIDYSDLPSALRGLVCVLAASAGGETEGEWAGETPFLTRGVMIDASRNAVPKVETLKYYLRRMALMGLNRLLLYCEDTYEIAQEPFFGYFRGRYTAAELSAIDDYAALLGIETVLCLQTLGHLEQPLQWPRFAGCLDTARVLLADSPESYQWIERMLEAAASSVRSRVVHIGMDEAHGIGSGRYRLKFGFKEPFEILTSHLEKVVELCGKHGLKPMIWSDMYFRLGSASNSYYDKESVVPPGIASRIPAGVDLVYWDYYKKDQAFYEDWIERHRQLGRQPVFATGIWTWNRFQTALPYTIDTMRPGMEAARRHGLSDVFATIWGDDGAECDLLSTLPAVQFFAEKCFGGDLAEANAHFAVSANARWEAWALAARIDHPGHRGPDSEIGNRAKWMLWHDPLLGLLEAHMEPDAAESYARLASELEGAAVRPNDAARLRFPLALSKTLAAKCAIHRDLRPAYRSRDLDRIRRMADSEIPELIESVEELRQIHYQLWTELYKPFGWEVLDLRYGGLAARLKTLRDVLRGWLANPETAIGELDAVPLPIFPGQDPFRGYVFNWKRASTASA